MSKRAKRQKIERKSWEISNWPISTGNIKSLDLSSKQFWWRVGHWLDCEFIWIWQFCKLTFISENRMKNGLKEHKVKKEYNWTIWIFYSRQNTCNFQYAFLIIVNVLDWTTLLVVRIYYGQSGQCAELLVVPIANYGCKISGQTQK